MYNYVQVILFIIHGADFGTYLDRLSSNQQSGPGNWSPVQDHFCLMGSDSKPKEGEIVRTTGSTNR